MMRLFLFLVLVAFFLNCTSKTENVTGYLQNQQVKLSPPRVSTTSAIIDSSIVLSCEFKMEGAKVRYTTDGTEPNKNSKSYEKPIRMFQAGIISFKGFHSDWVSSETVMVKTYKKGIDPATIHWQTRPNEKYPGKGNKGLIDHKKASFNFKDEQWVGFDSIAQAKLDFGQSRRIEKITVTYLVDTGSWIFPPQNVTVYLNDTDSIQVEIPKVKTAIKTLADIEIPIEKEVKQLVIRIQNLTELPEWHAGKGNKAWLFMDEWIFN